MKAYLLRNIPRQIWTAAKHTAVNEKITLRMLLLRSLVDYIKRRRDED